MVFTWDSQWDTGRGKRLVGRIQENYSRGKKGGITGCTEAKWAAM